MTLPLLSLTDNLWTVGLDPFDQPEFFSKTRAGGWALSKEFCDWLLENDPKHVRYGIQSFYFVRFGSEDTAMLFRLRYGATIRRNDA